MGCVFILSLGRACAGYGTENQQLHALKVHQMFTLSFEYSWQDTHCKTEWRQTQKDNETGHVGGETALPVNIYKAKGLFNITNYITKGNWFLLLQLNICIPGPQVSPLTYKYAQIFLFFSFLSIKWSYKLTERE